MLKNRNAKQLVCLWICLTLTAFLTACSSPRQSWNLSSPDGKITVTVMQRQLAAPYPSDELNLYYTVRYGKEEVINPSPLGVTMEGADGDFVRGLSYVSQTARQIDETYTLPSGKTSRYRNQANELVLHFQNAAGRQMDLMLRAYDDGIAYCYHFPGSGPQSILGEQSGFKVPVRSKIWASWWKINYENKYVEGIVGKDFLKGQKPQDEVLFPVLFETPRGPWVLITEAAVYEDYSYSHLDGDHRDAGLFEVALADNEKVAGTLPWTTPWRVAVIGDSLAAIVETVLVENLNPACEETDISWIKPGVFTSIWWHDSSEPLALQKVYDEFARQMGWSMPRQSYVDVRTFKDPLAEVEGWVRQSAKKGSEHIFADFIDSDSQAAVKFYDTFARLGMEYKQMVKYHGSTIPRGQRRRWPNLVGWEAVRGSEHYKYENWPAPTDICILPFTRNVVGSMDFTPPTFYSHAAPPKRTTSNAHELALVVVFECAVPQWWDHPDNYRKIPAAMEMLKKCPVVWDETRFLDGYPGDYACLARRRGDEWFIAGISSLPAHDVSVPLNFLSPGRYSLRLHRDGNSQTEIVSETLEVTSQTPLKLHLIDNGGFSGVLTKE